MMGNTTNRIRPLRRRQQYHSNKPMTSHSSMMALLGIVCYNILIIATTTTTRFPLYVNSIVPVVSATSSVVAGATQVQTLRGARRRRRTSQNNNTNNLRYLKKGSTGGSDNINNIGDEPVGIFDNKEYREDATGGDDGGGIDDNKKQKQKKTASMMDPLKYDRTALLYDKCKKIKTTTINKVPKDKTKEQQQKQKEEGTTDTSAPSTGVIISTERQSAAGEEIFAGNFNVVVEEEEIETETICDENGNLLPGQTSYSPTSTPPEDVVDPIDQADNDNDGLTNSQELVLGTDPNNYDTDGDLLSDGQELFLGTDPLKKDSDGDGYTDYQEVMDGSDPLDANDYILENGSKNDEDNDNDGLVNSKEVELGTDMNNPDTDGDGLTDGMEVNTQGTNPLLKDSDNDGLSDYDEIMIYGTNPNDADSDNDGLSDGFEVTNGFDPLVSSTELGDPLAVSPGCEAYMNNEVYSTTIEAAVNFVYEVAIDSSSTNVGIDEVNNDMENKLAKLVGRELIKCELDDVDDILKRNRRRRLLYNANEQHHRHLLVDGVNPTPKDIVLTQQTCTYYTTDNSETPINSNCYVIQGFMTLYLRENYPQSSTLQSSQLALRTLLNSMNTDDPSPFLEGSGDEDVSVDGVVGVRYIKGTPDAGGIKLIDNKGGVNGGNVDGLAEGDDTSSSGMLNPLSPVGITLMVLGSMGIIAVALIAARSVRKRKRPKAGSSEYAEFYDDDEDDLDMKHHGWYGEEAEAETDRDAASLNASPSPPKKQSRQFHYGEDEDSIFSGLSPGNNTNASEPAFVHTRTSSIDGMTTEQGYEAGMQFYPEQDPFPRTQYEPKVSLESPRYENPAGIHDNGGRVYSVGDTVEF